MQYRIEMSTTRRGAASVHLPGRSLALEAAPAGDTGWDVSIADSRGGKTGLVTLSAGTANDAVWRVAGAAVRAFAELTGSPLDRPAAREPDLTRASRE